MNPLRDMHIKPKLTAILVLTGVVPLLLVGVFMGGAATDALLAEAFDKLHTVQHIRKNQISAAVHERLGYLKVLAGRMEVHDLARDLAEHEHVSRGALLAPFQADTAEYRDLVRPANRPLHEALDTYNFHDLMLVSPLTGNVLYSVLGGRDLGANLAHGSLKDSGAALAWRGVVRTGDFQATDFAPYGAEQGAERAFLGYPVNDEAGTLTGVLVVSVTPEFVNRIMDSRQGLGASGEAYLISYDEHTDVYEFRSSLKTMGGGSYVLGSVMKPLDYWRDAVRDPEGGTALYVDSAGHEVLVAYDSMGFKGLNWYLISKVDKAEVTSAVANMTRMSLLVSGDWFCASGWGRSSSPPGSAGPFSKTPTSPRPWPGANTAASSKTDAATNWGSWPRRSTTCRPAWAAPRGCRRARRGWTTPCAASTLPWRWRAASYPTWPGTWARSWVRCISSETAFCISRRATPSPTVRATTPP